MNITRILLITFLTSLFLRNTAHSDETAPPQDFDSQHTQALANNPPGVSFQLRLAGGKTKYYPGEIIRLEALFSSSLAKSYTLDGATYDRSGRIPNEKFHLTPLRGTVDPYDDYYNREGAFFGGGLRSMPELMVKPHIVPLTLNEWLRFDQPGKYRLYDTSSRIIDQNAKEPRSSRELPVTSNIIEFEILPRNKAWEQAAIRDALRTLDKPYKPHQDDEARNAAASVLRHLNTRESIQAILPRLSNENSSPSFDFQIALFGSPYRSDVLREMEKRLSLPEQTVTSTFLDSMAALRMLLDYPEPVPALVPEGGKIPEDALKRNQLEYQKRWADRDIRLLEYCQLLAKALNTKTGKVRAASLFTLLDTAWSHPKDSPYAKFLETLQPQLIASFEELPVAAQASVLQIYTWGRIKSPAMLPVLRRLYSQRPPVDGSANDVIEMALLRIYELSPYEGRQLILREMKERWPRFRMNVLGVLPDKTLPQLDSTLIKNLENPGEGMENDPFAGQRDPATVPQLIARYSTAAILPRVKKHYAVVSAYCAIETQGAYLAYFLRTAPPYGASMVKKALAIRHDTENYKELLPEIAKQYTNGDLMNIAIAALDDSDPEVCTGAAKVLGLYGPPQAEAALQRRLAKWHLKWKDRADELSRRDRTNTLWPEINLECTLLHALSSGTHWFADKEKLEELHAGAITENARNDMNGDLGEWRGNIRLSFDLEDSPTWHVAQYQMHTLPELQAKMFQFPPGTVFHYEQSDTIDSKTRQALNDLQTFLKKHDLILKIPQ